MKNPIPVATLCVGLIGAAFSQEAPEPKSERVTLLPEDKPVSAQVLHSTAPFLRSLHTHPLLGRDFLKGDFEKQSPPVAIISSALWAALAASRPDIIGRKIRVIDHEFVVIAVAPRSPAQLEGMKVWLAHSQ